MLARSIVWMALLWPVLLGTAWASRATDSAGSWHALVYTAASHVCHQRPERSFQTAKTPWPVCARCSGLYLGAPFGAALASAAGRRRGGSARGWLAAGAVPTTLTLLLEWAGLPVTNMVRAIAAVPLGAIVTGVLVRTAAGEPRAIK